MITNVQKVQYGLLTISFPQEAGDITHRHANPTRGRDLTGRALLRNVEDGAL
jgi:hypothetical protein